jgi:hypothetical protein
LLDRLGVAKDIVITVGVHGPEGSQEHAGTKLSVAEVATIQEYGLGDCPERSFIRAWADETQAQHESDLRKVAAAIVKGKFDGRTGLERLGLRYVGEVQTRIANRGVKPELDPDGPTAKRKGSTVALVDKGQLKSAIRHKVHNKDPGESGST